MARETVERKIGRYVYRVNQLGAKEGGRAFVRLLKLVGGAAGGVEGGIAGAIEGIAKNVSEADFDWATDLFAKHTEVVLDNGKRPQLDDVFDSHFVGHYSEMFKWLGFAVEVNYGDVFLEWLKPATPPDGKPAPDSGQASEEQSTYRSTYAKTGTYGA